MLQVSLIIYIYILDLLVNHHIRTRTKRERERETEKELFIVISMVMWCEGKQHIRINSKIIITNDKIHIVHILKLIVRLLCTADRPKRSGYADVSLRVFADA